MVIKIGPWTPAPDGRMQALVDWGDGVVTIVSERRIDELARACLFEDRSGEREERDDAEAR